MPELSELYQTNADFKRYVDRYSVAKGITVAAALEHALVREYAEYCRENEILNHD